MIAEPAERDRAVESSLARIDREPGLVADAWTLRYSANPRMADFTAASTVMATHHNGEPLTADPSTKPAALPSGGRPPIGLLPLRGAKLTITDAEVA
ncbi:hypothetical protein ABZ916_35075 [Streptomyces sp. NPDC046853]|uniref:hypothetical protein n=1 Tax=Streptomyces sp. NPDC046853 TaxID=3154920 RepID=UPI003405B3A4